jgi:hypothetical protein
MTTTGFRGFTMKAAIWTLTVLLAAASQSEAKTWRVNTIGTGDAPDLYAAMDSAAAYDTVLVEAGQYQLTTGSLRLPRDVWLVGESGPARTLICRDEYAAPSTVSLSGYISGIHIRGNTLPVLYSHGGALDHCIIECSINGTALDGDPFYGVELTNCLLIGAIDVPGVFITCIIMSDMAIGAVGSSVYGCNVIGEIHPSIDVSGLNLNFSMDPQFCGVPGSGNYFLKSTSPCLPENNPFGSPTLTGPLPLGCGTVRVEQRTWGGVKALYR